MDDYRLLESAPDAMLIADVHGRILFVNARTEELFGYVRTDLLGESVELLVPERHRNRHAGHRHGYVGTPVARPMGAGLDLCARRRDGTEFPVDISISPVGSVPHLQVICAIRDISDRKRSEAALHESEARYRSLVRGATYGIYRATVEGRLLDVNAALVSMLGYDSEAALLAVNARDLYVDPEERDRLIERYRTSLLVPGVETRWKRRDGTPFTVKLSGRVLRERGGDPTGFEIIVEDVTHRRLLEGRLRTAEKLESVGRLTAGIAHHFNNLLTVTVGMLDLVRAQLAKDSSVRDDVATALEAARKAANLVRQMQDFGQLTKGVPVRLNLNDVLTELVPLLTSEAAEQVEIVLRLGEPLAYVAIDRLQFEAMMVSLLVNAREAMPDGGSLTITTRSDLTNGLVRLMASDTGVGMNEATVSRAFDPFFTTRELGQGAGLGLSAVHGLVTGSGGVIRVQSELGQGTTFTIEWPIAVTLE